MLSVYPACFVHEENGYSVIFPDLDHLATCGSTLDDALFMAVDCLAGYLYMLRQEKKTPPPPSPLEKIDPAAILAELSEDGEELPHSDLFVNLITVDVEEYAKRHFERSVKKTLSIPAWLNEAAVKAKINFSHVLQEALKEQLHIS